MADSNKNILITPATGTTSQPSIDFTGYDANTVSLNVLDDGTLSIEGSSGQLFSVSDNLTGTIFSVNDISGIPSIEVIDDGTIVLAEYSGNVGIGTSSPTAKLEVDGNISVTGTVDGRNIASDGSKLDSIATGANNYVHPSHPGDDINLDTGALSGATVISDLDFNVTTDTQGHVTDANATYATRNITYSDVGAAAASHSHSYIPSNASYTYTEGKQLSFRSYDTIDTASGDQASLEVYQDTAGADAFMQFHVAGDYAKYFGLHGGINDFVVGGWSYGAGYQRVFHDGYHPNADKWTTARTLSLSGDASGSVSWDGSANATLSVTVANDSHTHDGRYYTESESDSRFLRTNQSNLQVIPNIGLFTNDGGGNLGIRFNADIGSGTQTSIEDGSAWEFQFNNDSTSGDFVIYRDVSISSAGETITWEEAFKLKGSNTEAYLYGNQMFHDGYHPNADKWTTARTLSLTGDASGSVSWDGSANATLSVTVANDSHTHDGRYYTESESDSRFVNVSGDTITGSLNINGALNVTNINDNSGQQLIICAGEATSDASQTAEKVYVNAEGGFEVAASNDNWATGYAGTRKTLINYNGITYNGNEVWHAGNDGSGSGLDADTVDGIQASSFLRSATYSAGSINLFVPAVVYGSDTAIGQINNLLAMTKVVEAISLGSGTATIAFTIHSVEESVIAWGTTAQIYVNDVAVGTLRAVYYTATVKTVTYTENITVQYGDKIQLYMMNNGYYSSRYKYSQYSNFKILVAESSQPLVCSYYRVS